MSVRYDWDEEKNRLNFKKHTVWFEEAQTIWSDPSSVELFDPDHSEKEDRYIRIGFSTKNRLLLVVFCERRSAEIIRIISARKATTQEKIQYEEGI